MRLARSVFYDDKQHHLNIWWQGVLLLAVFFVLNVFLYLVDPRLLGDEALWLKPAKFEFSVALHFITLAVLAALLSPTKRNGKIWKAMSYAVVACGLFEVMYIFLQAARGRESHFNYGTPLESTLYGLMGIGAFTLVLGSFYLGYLLFREYQITRNQPLLLASSLGLTAGSVLTLVVAASMASQTDLGITDAANEALSLPVFGWVLNGQDLRIPHFFATHLMQILPLYGYWLSRRNLAGNNTLEAHLIKVTVVSCLLILVLYFLAVFTR